MSKENNVQGRSASSIVSSLAIGAVVGAGVALLFAPRSGKLTRSLVARKSRELQSQTSDAFLQARGAFNDKASRVMNAVEAGKEAMENEGARVLPKVGNKIGKNSKDLVKSIPSTPLCE